MPFAIPCEIQGCACLLSFFTADRLLGIVGCAIPRSRRHLFDKYLSDSSVPDTVLNATDEIWSVCSVVNGLLGRQIKQCCSTVE